jgi:hypothetical protein
MLGAKMKYILDFVDSITESELHQYLTDNNITVLKQFDAFGHVYLVSCDTEIYVDNYLLNRVVIDDSEGINLLADITINLTDTFTTKSFNIEDQQNWWKVASIEKIDFDVPVHNHPARGKETVVYIIDSGISSSHPEFINSDIDLLFSFNDDFNDYNGHGTALTSLIVGETCSVTCPRVKVVKIFENGTPTLKSDILAALDAIMTDYLLNGSTASVVNMSWSIPYDELINSKIQKLIDAGIFVVAAAGNSGLAITDVTPACIEDVITIGSFNQNLEPSTFSNYTGGSDISYTSDDVNYGALDGWAPGELIWAANKNGSYGYIAGTSAAAAIASAAFANNIVRYVSSTGEVCDFSFSNQQLSLYKFLTVSRPGLLDLSDQMYAGSINKVVTIVDNPVPTPINYIFRFRSGTVMRRPIVSPMDAVSFTYDSDLFPSFASFDERGILTAVVPAIPEGTYEILDPIKLTVLHKDESVSTLTVFFSILNNFNTTNLPDTDSGVFEYEDYVIPMTLLSYISGDRCDAAGTQCFVTEECASFCVTSSDGKDTFCNCATG